MKSGIYCIKNKKTKDFYLGSSINISKRWREHKRNLRKISTIHQFFKELGINMVNLLFYLWF